jgi:hypothetical protein
MTFDELIEEKEESIIDPYELWEDSNKGISLGRKGELFSRSSSMVSGTHFTECLKRPALRQRKSIGHGAEGIGLKKSV